MDPEFVRAIGRLEGKVDEIKGFIQGNLEEHKQRLDKLDKEVDGLRGKWKYAAGAAAVVTFLVSNSGTVQALFSFLPK